MKNIFILTCVFLFVTACGFKPVHGDTINSEKLASIKINVGAASEIPDKFAHKFRSVIKETFEQGNSSSNISYILDVKVTKALASYETQNNTNTRTRISLNVSFVLSDLAGKEMYNDRLIAIDSFQVSDSPYSALVTEEETTIRMTKEIANEIKLRVLRKLGIR
jgi:hypothetical protein